MKKSGIVILTIMTLILFVFMGILMVRIFSGALNKEGGKNAAAVEETASPAPEEGAPEEAIPAEENVSQDVSQETAPADTGAVPEEAPQGETPAPAEEAHQDVAGVTLDEGSAGKASFESFIAEDQGFDPAFSFNGLKNDVWSGFMRTKSGEDRDLVLPVTGEKGENILADAYRGIVCGSLSDTKSEGAFVPVHLDDDIVNDDTKLLYNDFITVYDIYSSHRYYAYDGYPYPSVLLFGSAEGTLSYAGRINENKVYELDPDTAVSDYVGVLAHLYAHDLLSEGRSDSGGDSYSETDEEICNILGNLALSLSEMEDSEGVLQSAGPYTDLFGRLKAKGMSDDELFRFFSNLAIKVTDDTDYESTKELMHQVMEDLLLSDYAGEV